MVHIASACVPINLWLLCAGPAAAPPPLDVQLARRVLSAHQETGDAAAAIDELSCAGRPIAVELAAERNERAFRLPGSSRPLALRELSFGEGGLGGTVWAASIALALWLGKERIVLGSHPRDATA